MRYNVNSERGARSRLPLPGDDRSDVPRPPRRRSQLQDRLQHPQRDGEPGLSLRPAAAAGPGRGPAAAPCAAAGIARKVFLVFFDWDRDTITPEGMQIIQQAADAFRAGAPVQIQVTGYTDRSGSPAYNQRLSERRANNVAGALVAARRAARTRWRSAAAARTTTACRPPTACASRRTAASRSSSRKPRSARVLRAPLPWMRAQRASRARASIGIRLLHLHAGGCR